MRRLTTSSTRLSSAGTPLEREKCCQQTIYARRGEDTIRILKNAKRLRRSNVHGNGAAEIHLDRGSATCPSGNRRLD